VNKSVFVALLIDRLKLSAFTVHQAADDADMLVVKVALELAASNHPVNVIDNDTDILVMLLHHYESHMPDIYMSSSSDRFVYSVSALSSSLGPVVRHLPAIHAISGSDTTSSVYGHGKVSVYKKLRQSAGIHPFLTVLQSPTSSHEEVMDAGHRVLVLLYGGSTTDELNCLRYSTYSRAAATGSQLPKPEKLPPTENAAWYHLYRVHLQAVQWKLLSTSCLNPLAWGWTLHNNSCIPIASDIDIAPPEILKSLAANVTWIPVDRVAPGHVCA